MNGLRFGIGAIPFLILIGTVVFPSVGAAVEVDGDGIVEEWSVSVESSRSEEEKAMLDLLSDDAAETAEEFGFGEGGSVALSRVVRWTLDLFSNAFREEFGIFCGGVLLVLFLKFVSGLPSGGDGTVMAGLGFLCAAVSGAVSFSELNEATAIVKSATESVSSFLTSSVPIFAATQVGGGNPSVAASVSVLTAVGQGVSYLIASLCVPLCTLLFSAALSGGFGSAVTLRPLIAAAKKIGVRCAEILSAVTVGVISVTKVFAVSSDSVSTAAVRTFLSQALPVAGGSLASGLESALRSGTEIGARVGVVGSVGIAVLLASPCVKCAVLTGMYGGLEIVGKVFEVPILSDFYGDVKDVFGLLCACSVLSLILICASVLILTGGFR